MIESKPAMHEPQEPHPVRRRQSLWMNVLVAGLREPLVHFLLLGAGVFLIYMGLQTEPRLEEQQIVVSAGKIEHLAAIFTRTWQRPPTQLELQGLIDDYVREEVAYREGKRMGLEQDDTIIRRRIRQKLDFVAEDLSSEVAPTDEALAAYFEEHRENYRIEPTLTFRHVFFNPELHQDTWGKDAAAALQALQALRSNSDLTEEELGDRTLLEHRYERVSQSDIVNLLGGEFASTVVELQPGKWHGPVRSAYGFHLVFIEDRELGRLPEFDDVRANVLVEWQHQHRQSLTENFYRSLLEKYTIVVDWPQAMAEAK